MKKSFVLLFALLILSNIVKADSINVSPGANASGKSSNGNLRVRVEDQTPNADVETRGEAKNSWTFIKYGALVGAVIAPVVFLHRSSGISRVVYETNSSIANVGLPIVPSPDQANNQNNSQTSGSTVLSTDFSSYAAGAIVLNANAKLMNASPSNVPEPATIGLLAVGMTSFAAYARRRKGAKSKEGARD
jgi:hypothetical protein